MKNGKNRASDTARHMATDTLKNTASDTARHMATDMLKNIASDTKTDTAFLWTAPAVENV